MGGQPTEPTLLPTGKDAKELARDGGRILGVDDGVESWKGCSTLSAEAVGSSITQCVSI
jgi:hypothetical protein